MKYLAKRLYRTIKRVLAQIRYGVRKRGDLWKPAGETRSSVQGRPARKILALYFDALPAKRLGTFGGPIPTPNFDRLARRGTLFEKFIVSAPSTAMSITSMFTGLFPHEFGRRSWSNEDRALPENHIPLLEILTEKGFGIHFLWDETFMSRRTQSKYRILDWDRYPSIEFFDIADKEIQGDQTVDLLQALMKSDQERWLCYVRFSDATSSRFVGSAREYSPYTFDDAVIEADTILGRILEVVDDSVDVVVFSDHGRAYGERGLFGYAFNLAEQTIHVPFLCSWGGGQRISDLTSMVEFPNIILRKPLRSHKYLYVDTAYADQWSRSTSVIDGRWKYVYHRTGWPKAEEFYDLHFDPHEQINLVGKYRDPYRDKRPKGDTTSEEFSPSGLELDGKDVSEVYGRRDWQTVRAKIRELRSERERIWLLQGIDEHHYD